MLEYGRTKENKHSQSWLYSEDITIAEFQERREVYNFLVEKGADPSHVSDPVDALGQKLKGETAVDPNRLTKLEKEPDPYPSRDLEDIFADQGGEGVGYRKWQMDFPRETWKDHPDFKAASRPSQQQSQKNQRRDPFGAVSLSVKRREHDSLVDL
eukprot:Cvel_26821.t2-p1 / transcript=Cvel_26821.t2 / gene=Cvel_26821 / organism=Chromera_velia_CCMP2878 / gene_product=Putative ankyrin repeat protein RF_0381, putative / transcript_product=Putative ankyrin repeat protein RF_0381, putative / location=Cvel_scaffold3249:6321-6782(-) / protein_length=154 / sequence_SO=supercontig / SO=protein_coding / is_pseudo=false